MGVAAAALGLMAVGTGISVIGSLQEGEAAHAAALYNARLATMQANEEADRTRLIGRRRASLNVTRVAKSGVRLEGSPLAVLADNAYQIERQAQSQFRAGRAASILYRMQGRQARVASRYEAASSILTGAGSAIGGAGTNFGFGGTSLTGTTPGVR